MMAKMNPAVSRFDQRVNDTMGGGGYGYSIASAQEGNPIAQEGNPIASAKGNSC